MAQRTSGHYEQIGTLSYFIPAPLPPMYPPLMPSAEMMDLYGVTMHQLGQLNEIAARLPNPTRFIKAYVIKEAMLSSAIEGIHTTLLDVFTQPIGDEKPDKETQLVLNYTKALDRALQLLENDNIPLSSRVLLAAHETLMSQGEGDRSNPGNYRTQAVRVGNLVPPPAPQVPGLIADLERFIHNDNSLPPLIKVGLAHVQFETIHPFNDGNGRIGRLLIVLMLLQYKLLHIPILYPSYHFKRQQADYYRYLDGTRTDGDFEGWIMFYLKALQQSASDACTRARDIEALEQQLVSTLRENPRFQKDDQLAPLIVATILKQPILGTRQLQDALGKSYNTTAALIDNLVSAGIVQPCADQRRNKLFACTPYLKLLEKEY